ncbi:MAG TPA: hypothetical protein VM510_01375 [Caulifigura sp.]|nr:hypothetical protein [Caulifigura sp.]
MAKKAAHKKASRIKPGEKTPASGQYRELGPRGGKMIEKTMIKGHKVPPTETKGATYKLVDRTHNKSGES